MACIQFLSSVPLIVFAALLLLCSSFTPSQFLVQGRQFPDANPFFSSHQMKDEEEELALVKMRRVLIGSRPPRCDGTRCSSSSRGNYCGPCEAVQVPIAAAARIQYSRGDDVSNYKPMCWKCKCGHLFFNPP